MDEFQYQNPPQGEQQRGMTPEMLQMARQQSEAAQQQAAPQPTESERRRMVRQANVGKHFCRNCGEEIQAGASVCVHCNTVLNPLAVKKAQEIVMNRRAEVTKSMLIKSFFFPKNGMKLYRQHIQNRPQVANPCRKAAIFGRLTRGLVIAGVIALIILL